MNLLQLSAQTDARRSILCGGVPNGPAAGWVWFGRFRPMWLGGVVLAACAALSMLWVFHSVVRSSMVQGEARRVTAVQHELAVWHCARSGGRVASDTCVAQIGSRAQ